MRNYSLEQEITNNKFNCSKYAINEMCLQKYWNELKV